MSTRPFSYKSDKSFLENVEIGAVGARKTLELLNAANHEMMELERESMRADVWSDIKFKGIRVPDLVGRLVPAHTKNDAER